MSGDYYKTEPWIRRSDLYRSTHPNCEVCGIPPDTAKRWYRQKINVHHRNYLRWGAGQELDEDLLSLCKRCHAVRHYLPVGDLRNYVEYAPWLEVAHELLRPSDEPRYPVGVYDANGRMLDLAKRGHLLAGGVK